jgi:hypothetical protein
VKKIEEEEKPTEYRMKREPKKKAEEEERKQEGVKQEVRTSDDVPFQTLKEVASTPRHRPRV